MDCRVLSGADRRSVSGDDAASNGTENAAADCPDRSGARSRGKFERRSNFAWSHRGTSKPSHKIEEAERFTAVESIYEVGRGACCAATVATARVDRDSREFAETKTEDATCDRMERPRGRRGKAIRRERREDKGVARDGARAAPDAAVAQAGARFAGDDRAHAARRNPRELGRGN